jgi:diguanylate cyclase (GGDEF)-like protein
MQYKDTPTAPGFCSAWLRGLGFHLRTWAVLLWACCLCAGVDAQTVQTGAVPTLVFGSGDHRVDLRGMWEGGVIEAAPDANTPDALWAMDAKRFGRGAGEALLSLKPGQRFVARLRIQTNSTADALYLEIPMARLDRVQVSYRSALGAWSTWVAGDRVAMQDWPVLGTYPRFVLPANGGALDVVIEVAHKGAFRMPAYVSSSQSFLRASMSEQLGAGGLLGLGLTIALLGFLMGNTFHRWGFVVIAIMTLGFSAGIATNSGLAGAYLFTQSQVFNDIAKFATSLLAVSLLPHTVSGVLDHRFRARRIWRASQLWTAFAVLVLAVFSWQFDRLSGFRFPVLAAALLVSVAAGIGLAAWAVFMEEAHAQWVLLGAALMSAGFVLPLLSFYGLMALNRAFLVAGLLLLPGVMALIHAVFLQYRTGRAVFPGPGLNEERDELTGLYNRRGFEQALARTNLRMSSERSCAAFYLIDLPPSGELRHQHGDEGFEHSLVRLAATLAASLESYDIVSRISRNQFAAAVIMPKQNDLARELATRVLSHMLNLTPEVAPISRHARIAIAWMPDFGTTLDELRAQCQEALGSTPATQKIVWVS